jgi:ElaB/YqjD/DUF883 family membrane-anchored ribosome-binding protein
MRALGTPTSAEPFTDRYCCTSDRRLALEEKLDQPRAREIAKDAAERGEKAADEAVQRAGAQGQPALDQGKALVQDLADRASEIGTQAVGRAGEFIEGVAPQAKEVASNLYEHGSQSGEYARKYVAEQPLTALLIAGAIGYGLAYLVHRR